MGLNGKIAWITGAGSGIGRAGARALAEAGASVVVSGRRPELLQETVAAIAAAGGTAEPLPLDVKDAAAVAAAADDLIVRLGRVDILVNSAGLNIPRRNWPVVDPAGLREVFAANVDGTFHCIHALLPSMRARRDGLIINIASWAGRYSSPLTGPAYTGAKHAVVAMTMSLNQEECVNGIRACVINPGEVATPIMLKRPVPPPAEELERMLQPEDLGRTIRFVAEMPPHVCVNEILIGPTWNRGFVAALAGGPR